MEKALVPNVLQACSAKYSRDEQSKSYKNYSEETKRKTITPFYFKRLVITLISKLDKNLGKGKIIDTTNWEKINKSINQNREPRS